LIVTEVGFQPLNHGCCSSVNKLVCNVAKLQIQEHAVTLMRFDTNVTTIGFILSFADILLLNRSFAARKCVDVSAFQQTGCSAFNYWHILICVFLPSPVLCSLRYMQVSLCPFQLTTCHYRLYILFIHRRRRTLRAVVSVVSCRRISLPCRDAACSFTCVCVSD